MLARVFEFKASPVCNAALISDSCNIPSWGKGGWGSLTESGDEKNEEEVVLLVTFRNSA